MWFIYGLFILCIKGNIETHVYRVMFALWPLSMLAVLVKYEPLMPPFLQVGR